MGDEGIPFGQIAETIGRKLNIPVTSIPTEEADAYFGFLSLFVQLDNPTSSDLDPGTPGWHPTHPGLIEDLDEGHYFNG